MTVVYEGRTRPLGQPPACYAPGRVCLHPDCTQVLSVYNGGRCCCLHNGWTLRGDGESYGSKPKMTDAAPVREHLLALLADGMHLWMVELKTGIPSKTIRDIRDGLHKRCHKDTAAAILATKVGR